MGWAQLILGYNYLFYFAFGSFLNLTTKADKNQIETLPPTPTHTFIQKGYPQMA